MPLRKTKKAKCESCGRVWSPRKPDAPKLKCPTCGKYKVEIFDEEVKENESERDNDDGSCSGGVSVPVFSPPDLPYPGDRKDGENDHLLAGEKDPAVEESGSGSGSPELEEPITDPLAASDPDRPPDPSPVPAAGLGGGGGLWVGLAVGVVSAIWYLYRKRSLAEDLDTVIPDQYGSYTGRCHRTGRRHRLRCVAVSPEDLFDYR